MPNNTIHEEIESWLAADVHCQLSQEERADYEQHLAECAPCRALQQEEKNMHELLEKTLKEKAADPALGERMVSHFRHEVLTRDAGGFAAFLAAILRTRSTQIAAIAALLLSLVQVGKMVTGEHSAFPKSQPSTALVASPRQEEKNAELDRTSITRSDMQPTEQSAALAKTRRSTDALAPGGTLKSDQALLPAAPLSTGEVRQKEKDLAENRNAAEGEPSSNETAPATIPATSREGRKLIRNAQLDLRVASYELAVQRLTILATEEHGFVATQNSSRLPNGKLQGSIVVKVLPENLDRFLQKARSLGELKSQTLGTEDVSKAYFDTDARLRNAQRMETRLLDILQKKTGKVSDLLEVEKELARVREQIEQMQGELKYYDALVQYATVTISLAEKDLEEPAAFLLKETANLSLFSSDVEKTFVQVRNALQNAKAQIVQSTLDRDNSGQATAHLSLLLEPAESDTVIARIKAMGRVQNFNVQTERVAQDGSGLSNTARVERDKVQLNLVISKTGEEPAVQHTNLRILTGSVAEKVAKLKAEVAQASGLLRTSTFIRNSDGQEVANLTFRVSMKNYAALVASFDQLGEVKDLSVQRNDQPDTTANPETAPAEISVQIYSQGKIVADESGIVATIRRTLGQGVAALAWSVRMIGVALAFLAPWALALGCVVWFVARSRRAR